MPMRFVNHSESGYFSNGVDVDGGRVADIARFEERMLGEVVAVAAFDGCDTASIQCPIVV